jgi:mRNA-degrading endonuclease toxin of MazEF toxin-antitoxin module
MVDRNGAAKERPCIIVTPSDRIRKEDPLPVMAVTTTFADPPPAWHVPLPWNPNPRQVGTGLARRSAAVVSWVNSVRVEEVLDVRGEVPAKVMRRIEQELAAWAAAQKDPDKPQP